MKLIVLTVLLALQVQGHKGGQHAHEHKKIHGHEHAKKESIRDPHQHLEHEHHDKIKSAPTHQHSHNDEHKHDHHDHHDHDHHDHSHDHSHNKDRDIREDNFHIRLVATFLNLIQANSIISVFDKIIRPLPSGLQAVVSTVFISVVPIFLIYSINKLFFSSKKARERVNDYMISFAIGGLLGDVFFHTLPHIGGGHDHGHSHGESHGGHAHDPAETFNNFIIVLGIISFFLLEKITHAILEKSHSHGHSHSHNHNHGKKKSKVTDATPQ